VTAQPTFPLGVIIAIDEACITFDNETRSMTIAPFLGDEENDPIDGGSIAKFLDGQYRIAGLQNYSGKHFDLNVIVFVGADLSDQAGTFSTVNLEQTKVRTSLAFDLLQLAKTRSPEKTCHNVAVALDAKAGSPFLRRIKRLGVATPGRKTRSFHKLPL
jgi:DGQHR domain-containing protein